MTEHKSKANMYRDAVCVTPFDPKLYEGRDITVSIGANQFSKMWKPQKLSVEALIHKLTKHEEGKKDGLAIVFADMVPGARTKKTIKACTGIGLDIDTGTPAEEVDAAVAKLGCLAVRWSTHSDGKTTSDVNKDKVIQWTKTDRVTTETIRDYLRNKQHWHDSIVDVVEYIDDDHTEKGIVCRVSHPPMSKHRIFVPVLDPYVFAHEAKTQQEAMAKWAKVPLALATLLGMPFDTSCTDNSRLFYLPRHAKGQRHSISLFGGQLFDYRTMNLESQFEAAAAQFAKGGSKSKTTEGKALGAWWKKHAHGFQLMDVIEHYASDKKRSKATLGYNIECPFDDGHTNAGDMTDTACYAANAAEGGNEFCFVKCQHQSCKEYTTLDMLGRMIANGWFSASVLEDPAFDIIDHEVDCGSGNPEPSVDYGGALNFNNKRGALPKGVTFDKETGSIYPTFRNALLLIGAEGWDLGYNELTQNFGMRGEVAFPWPEHLGYAFNDPIRREVRLHLISRWGVTFKIQDVEEACLTLARRNAFNPVCDYLNDVQRGWDGVARVDRWLETYLGVTPTKDNEAYVRAIAKIVLVAGARRARQPGCKYDEMLILEGPQGWGKSTALRILGGDYFSDANLGNLTEKQAPMKLRGVWLQEFGELTALRKAEVDELKEFLAYQSDKYKIPYAKFEEDFLRRCFFIGTVNPGGGAYLVDLTGNRRFWPITCGIIDLEALSRDRDQLWAEAAMMESRGDSIRLDPSLYEAAKAEQDARLADDPWVERLAEYLERLNPKIGHRVLSIQLLDALNIPTEKQNQTATKNLKRAMTQIQTWEYKPSMRLDGVKSAGYVYVGTPTG